jgi:hypothetical protein
MVLHVTLSLPWQCVKLVLGSKNDDTIVLWRNTQALRSVAHAFKDRPASHPSPKPVLLI